MVVEDDLTLGAGHTLQYTDIMYHRNVHFKLCNLINHCCPNRFNLKNKVYY